MRKIDWTDYRQALNENGMNHEQAVKKLSERWSLQDVYSAQKGFNARAKNPLIEKAMMEENCPYSNGNPVNQRLLKENGMALAEVIRAGAKK